MRMTGVTRTALFSHRVGQLRATIVCLLALLILPGGAWAAQTPGSPDMLGSIAGVVTDAQGVPLPNIEVSAFNNYNPGGGGIAYAKPAGGRCGHAVSLGNFLS